MAGKKLFDDAERLNLVAPRKLIVAFKRLADKRGTSLSVLVREAMITYLRLQVQALGKNP